MRSISFCGVSKVYRRGMSLFGVDGSSPDVGEGVSAGGGERLALDRLDLTVEAGELLVLMGPSGSGKTTALRLIAGLEEPTEGRIEWSGSEQRMADRARMRVGMVFQGANLYGHLTVNENLAFGLERRGAKPLIRRWFGNGTKSEDTKKAVQESAKLLGIESMLGKRPGELSGGEQQRVAIGRALVRKPGVLLLDEPLASLDGPTRLGLRREIRDIQKRLGITMVYVTHDQAEALAVGDRIAVLHHGRLQQVGKPDEVYSRPGNRVVASLFGNLGMCFIEGLATRSDGLIVWEGGGWMLRLSGAMPDVCGGRQVTKVAVGFRPDDILVGGNQVARGVAMGQGIVTGREYQGGAVYVTAIANGGKSSSGEPPIVMARCEGRVPNGGDCVELLVNIENASWFDGETGLNVGVKADRRGAK
jgi:multiple sugar transport system ATP-binding protein